MFELEVLKVTIKLRFVWREKEKNENDKNCRAMKVPSKKRVISEAKIKGIFCM